jgi:hypothetical protein
MVLSNLFIVSTPRHWLISVFLRLTRFQDEPAMIVFESGFPRKLAEDAINLDFFSDVEILPAGSENSQIRTMANILGRRRFSHILTGSVNEPFVQFGIHSAKLQNPNLASYLLDDGLFSYQATSRKPMSVLRLFSRKLKYGWWYQEPNPLKINAPWIDGAFLFFPDKLQGALPEKNVHGIDSNWLSVLDNAEVLKKLNEIYGLAPQLAEIDVVVILDVYRKAIETSQDYPEDVVHFLTKLDQGGKRFLLKYHPRDKANDPLEIQKRFPKQTVLPGEIPFELLLPNLNENVMFTGDISTILLEAKSFLPNADVSVVLIGSHDRTPLPMLRKAGVKVVDVYRDLQV